VGGAAPGLPGAASSNRVRFALHSCSLYERLVFIFRSGLWGSSPRCVMLLISDCRFLGHTVLDSFL
jgi:hypothetical protein